MKTGKRRLAAFAVVAATMLLALVGVAAPAWAEEGSATPHLPVNDNKVTITSTLTMNKNAVEPNAEFGYSIAPAETSELASTSNNMPVSAGVPGGATLPSSSVNFSAQGLHSQDNADGITKTITAPLNVSLDTSKFTLRASIDIRLRRRRHRWMASTLRTRSSSSMFT